MHFQGFFELVLLKMQVFHSMATAFNDKPLIAYNDQLKLAIDRFNFLNSLRIATAQRHITIVGLVVATMVTFTKLDNNQVISIINGLKLPIITLLLLLGYSVTIYDAMILHRSSAPVIVANRVAELAGLDLSASPVDNNKKTWWIFQYIFEEDVMFVSQLFLVNPIPLFLYYIAPSSANGSPEATFANGGTAALVYFVGVATYVAVWFLTYFLYKYHGPIDGWLPRTRGAWSANEGQSKGPNAPVASTTE